MRRQASPAGWLESASRYLLPALLLVALGGAWQAAASAGILADALSLPRILVPSPAEVASTLWTDRQLLAENAWVTLQEIVLGLACAIVAGTVFALLLHPFELLRRAFYPLLVASQTIPIVVLAPILLVWLGFGIGPKLVVVALICFFPITVNTLDGLRSVDPEAVKMLRTLDASRWQLLTRLEAPTAAPHFFSGARVAFVIAPIGAVFGELVASDPALGGLGALIQQDNAHLETARMFASVFVLSSMALALFGLLALVERRVVTWR